MFTGIIETMGELIGVEREGEITHLQVRAPEVAEGLVVGDHSVIEGKSFVLERVPMLYIFTN